MLTPVTANVAGTVLVRFFFARTLWNSDTTLGVAAFGQGGSVDWTIPDPASNTPPGPNITKNAFVFGAGIGPVLRIWPRWLDTNAIKLNVTPSFTFRSLSGDAGARAFRTAALGTSTSTVYGGQFDVELRINEVFATATVTRLSGNIPGLSSAQFLVSIGFRGGVDLSKPIPAS
jgi:hypothetical protein